jgi:hypothetical protein
MLATNPITNESGTVYDRYAISLVISGTYTPDGPEASVVCNLTPLAITEAGIETAPDLAKSIRIGSFAQADNQTLAAMSEIQTALQKFITSKGL